MRIPNNASLPLMMAVFLVMFSTATLAETARKAPVIKVTKQTVDGRIENLSRLIHTSSGAKRVARSGNAKAIAEQKKAAKLLDKARKAYASGDVHAANQLLNQATGAMFGAIRLVGAGKSVKQKHVRDFKARAASVDALLTALKRIAREKKLERRIAPVIIDIRKKVSDAWVLKREGKLPAGRKILDKAYVTAKVTIEHLRDGDTLVRSLNFASKEEEYQYEIDRNDTHQMLLKVLARDKMKHSERVRKLVGERLRKAQSLRRKAEAQAQRGQFGKAVRTLEDSTKELVRAIRGAGVYIPG